MTPTMSDILNGISLVPVVAISRKEHAVPLAQAFLAAGINTIEVTLRTDCALAAIEAIAHAVPDISVGAGSVIEAEQMKVVTGAGADYAVSPGYTDELIDAACLPYLPGASTASEVLYLRDKGFRLQKFFPAQASGGLAALKAIHAPIPDVRFCPTGGLNAVTAAQYLEHAFVEAVGGSWFIDQQAIDQGSWDSVEASAARALATTQGKS